MNPNNFRSVQLNFSGIGFWITVIAIIWLLGSIGLGWLVKSFFILIGLLLILPIIAFAIFRWWLQRNLVESDCPVCGTNFAAFNKTETRCPSCGEPLQVQQGEFLRATPPGTVDVDVVEIPMQQLDE